MSRPLRRPMAVVLSRFPRVTETFILREVLELERQGQPVVLAPLIREHPPVVHPEARPWLDRALFTPYLSPAVVASNLRALARRPGGYLALLGRLVAGTVRRPEVLAKTLVLFPKSVHLASRLADAGVEHVHAHFATYPATAALVARELAGLPYSLTIHAHDIFVDRSLLGPKLRGARFVRSISEFNRRFLAERHPEVADRLRVVHVGVDPAAYGGAGGPPDERRGAAGRPVRIVSVAALEPYKGIDVLVEAVARLRHRPGLDVRCEVLGEGAERPRLEAEVARRGLGADAGAEADAAFRLPGALPQGEVARRLAAADLFVLPSVVAADGQMEGIPVALMEAMASGLPVVASDLSGIPELVEDGVTGLLAPPGDPAALAEVLERLVEDLGTGGALARRLGAAGRERVAAEFSLEATVRELLGLLDAERGAAGREEDEPLLAAALERLGVPSGSAVPGLRRVHRRPDSTVWELLLPAAGPEEAGRAGRPPKELVVKAQRTRPGQSAPPPERARREHALLERLRAAGGEGPWTVPRPLALLAEGVDAGRDGADGVGVVAMDRAAGVPLDALIRCLRLRRDPRPLERAFAGAGAWLRWFQGVVGPDRRHGDLWPGNLWVDAGAAEGGWGSGAPRVEGIDFEGSGPGTPWDDAAYFLLHARRYFRVPGLGRRFARLERAFLEGFRGAAPTAADRAALAAATEGVARELRAPAEGAPPGGAG